MTVLGEKKAKPKKIFVKIPQLLLNLVISLKKTTSVTKYETVS